MCESKSPLKFDFNICQIGMIKKIACFLMLLTVLMFGVGCSSQNSDVDPIVGKWFSEKSQQTIEFTADGIYKGVEQKNYTYEIVEGKQLKIVNPEYKDGSDSIIMDYVVDGDVLTTTYNESAVTWKRQ